MQFKYPEILYALTLLLIPIFIHLFQLRRFEKVSFTNVAFLKKVELQTRKSSKLKKFLILLSRLGLFAALIIAFAQPYFSNNKDNLQPNTVLYLDNSFSMQVKNGNKELFKDAVQKITSNYKNISKLTIITNDDIYKDLTNKDLKNQLLSLEYSPFSKEINTILLRAEKGFNKSRDYKNHFILVSDFQSNIINNKLVLNKDVQYTFVQLLPQNKQNISIDSLYIAKQDGLNIDLNVKLTSYNSVNENLSVSLFKDKILVGKSSCSIEKNKSNIITFKIPFNDSFNGKVVIDDNLIEYDNELFFSLNKLEKINVLAIGNKNEFLTKIYSKSEFNLISNNLNQIDYNEINNQNLIILNELELIPLSLQKVLVEFVKNDGSLVLIPSLKSNIANYNKFLLSLRIGSVSNIIEQDHQVNTINFSHSILNNVFEKKIKNFQYPNVKSVFNTSFKREKAILKFDNQNSFISEINTQSGKVYWFASAINQKNSNFKASPLIVPVFYNFGKQSFKLTNLYYTIGNKNEIEVKTKIVNDEVLSIEKINDKEKIKFIPLQQISQQKVILKLEDNPNKAGFYHVLKRDNILKDISFNTDRVEGDVDYFDIEKLKNNNVSISNSINQSFSDINKEYSIQSFWKYFILMALLFLIIELLLIKFLKQ